MPPPRVGQQISVSSRSPKSLIAFPVARTISWRAAVALSSLRSLQTMMMLANERRMASRDITRWLKWWGVSPTH